MAKKKTTKPKLAEVTNIKEVNPDIIQVLEELLYLAESGEINSLRIVADINRKSNFISVGEVENLPEAIGIVEIIKTSLVDELFFSLGEGEAEQLK